MADHPQIPKNEKHQYCPRSKEELKELVKDESVSLGQIDTVYITDMSELFARYYEKEEEDSFLPTLHCIRSDFSGISSWNVSNVTDMSFMFCSEVSFNEDISRWDVSNVTNMSAMFLFARRFNGDISHWDVSNVTDMSHMFDCAVAFNGDVSRWDVSNVTNMSCMFNLAKAFNGDVSCWDVSNVTDMSSMFDQAKAFNGDVSRWDVSNVTDMSGMFAYAKRFNGDISHWDVSNVTDMSGMFHRAWSFNGDIRQWNVRKVKKMDAMFLSAHAFHRDISCWYAPRLTNSGGMFVSASAFTRDTRLYFSSLKNAKEKIYDAIKEVRRAAEKAKAIIWKHRRKKRHKKYRMLGKGEIPMMGAIIGDIVGSPFECGGMPQKDFLLFSEMCEFTDDTVMTLAVGKAILEAGGARERLAKQTAYWMRRLGNLYAGCSYGALFYEWLTDEAMPAYHSFGNGAAMRVSPCAFAAKTLEEALDMARIVTAVTHDHPEGIKGAEATTAAVFLAKSGATKKDIKAYIEENYYALDFSLDSIRPTYEFNVTCQGTVPQAIVAFLEATDFEDAVRNAVSLNGDSDTLGAIAGAIAGAYYGVPAELREKALDYLDEPLLALLSECKKAFAMERSK